MDVCGKLHREFVKKISAMQRFGEILSSSLDKKIGPDHILEDKDVLRIILKKNNTQNLLNSFNF
ncbi:TGS domain-containing protein [Methanobrevibacter arboriphilus]|uniref:TGS domain-containing protein n=1 Tax=Methanobrevibacter arboriphilus TaxID=39441 RepID=UPI000A65C986|nr:TGS domain-containing protein [Methanobrevibacter arboriphilus]